MNKFAERLKEILKYNHISQNEFAKKIGMSQSIVNNYCTGRREPSLDALMLICKTLDESADYMLGLED
jgi:transcriptional regulator with XRE-family HTH domain